MNSIYSYEYSDMDLNEPVRLTQRLRGSAKRRVSGSLSIWDSESEHSLGYSGSESEILECSGGPSASVEPSVVLQAGVHLQEETKTGHLEDLPESGTKSQGHVVETSDQAPAEKSQTLDLQQAQSDVVEPTPAADDVLGDPFRGEPSALRHGQSRKRDSEVGKYENWGLEEKRRKRRETYTFLIPVDGLSSGESTGDEIESSDRTILPIDAPAGLDSNLNHPSGLEETDNTNGDTPVPSRSPVLGEELAIGELGDKKQAESFEQEVVAASMDINNANTNMIRGSGETFERGSEQLGVENEALRFSVTQGHLSDASPALTTPQPLSSEPEGISHTSIESAMVHGDESILEAYNDELSNAGGTPPPRDMTLAQSASEIHLNKTGRTNRPPQQRNSAVRVNAPDLLARAVNDAVESTWRETGASTIQVYVDQLRQELNDHFQRLSNMVNMSFYYSEASLRASTICDDLASRLEVINRQIAGMEEEATFASEQLHDARQERPVLVQVGAYAGDIRRIRDIANDDFTVPDVRDTGVDSVRPIFSKYWGTLERLRAAVDSLENLQSHE